MVFDVKVLEKQFIKFKKRFFKWFDSLNLIKIAKVVGVVAAVLAVGTSYVWFTRVYMDGERRFWLAIDNSLSTPSVVRTLEQGGSGNKVVQDYRFHYAPVRLIENKVEFTEKSATTDTSITTEGIITTSDQYLRYTDFSSDDGNSLGPVLGQWAVQSPAPLQAEEARLNYLSEQVTLAIFGNFGPNYRAELIEKLKSQNVYKGELNSPAEQVIDGEDMLVYAVQVDLRAYAGLLRQAFVDAGYGDFPPLDPEGYREGSTVSAQFIVRKKDNAFVTISFGGRTESYSNYGVVKQVDVPEGSISIDELQRRVEQQLQQ